jgi:hypothetical protein
VLTKYFERSGIKDLTGNAQITYENGLKSNAPEIYGHYFWEDVKDSVIRDFC